MYRVIKHFVDLHDNDHSYEEGDIFPREGVSVLKERIAELAGSDNKQHTPLIELVEEAESPNENSGEEADIPDENSEGNDKNAPDEQPGNDSDTSAENSEEKAPASKAKKSRSKKAEETPAE